MGLGGMVGRNDDRDNDMRHIGAVRINKYRKPVKSKPTQINKRKHPNNHKLVELHKEVFKDKKSLTQEAEPIKSFKSLYKALTSATGNKDKISLLTPVFQNLFEESLVYYNRITMLVQVEITLSEAGLTGNATKISLLNNEDKLASYNQHPKTWKFHSPWNEIWFTKQSVYSVYQGWRLWPDPGLVKKITELVLADRREEALKMTSLSLKLK